MSLAANCSRIEPGSLDDWIHDGKEVAIIDIREAGQYGRSHLFYAVPLPYSRLEAEIARLVPQRFVRIVLVDDDEALADRARDRLHVLGYENVSVLRGGIKNWRAKGYRVFSGVHVPSKAFGEFISHELDTPSIPAKELHERQRLGDNLIVVDGRPLDEYSKMNIPGAVCCPNGELAYRIRDIVHDSSTTVVVNCAGRTRSIIGAQTLIDLGLENRVFSLENGTQGWFLEDFALERGMRDQYPTQLEQKNLARAHDSALALEKAHSIDRLAAAEVEAWRADTQRTTFLCDVRTGEEYQLGTMPGAIHAPGGQLVQATDTYIGVLNARLILMDTDNIRASVIAVWLKRMGWEVAIFTATASELSPPSPRTDFGLRSRAMTSRDAIEAIRLGEAALIDLRPSMEHRKMRVRSSIWSIRPRLLEDAASLSLPPLLLVPDYGTAYCALEEFRQQNVEARFLVDAPDFWEPGLVEVECEAEYPAIEDCIDYLFFAHDRHSGNKSAAREYLAWELDLVDSMDPRDVQKFRVKG